MDQEESLGKQRTAYVQKDLQKLEDVLNIENPSVWVY
jgi:hypothetical protein